MNEGSLLSRADVPSLETARKRAILVEVFKSLNQISPPFMWDLLKLKVSRYNLRSGSQVCRKQCRTIKYGINSLSNYGATLWNSLPNEVKVYEQKAFMKYVSQWTETVFKCYLCKQTIKVV